MRVWLLLIAACSTPAPKQDPVYTPPDDEQKSVQWQAAQPDAMGGGWTFDWQFYRDAYDKLMKTPVGSTKCDWRAKPRPDVECLPPDRPRQHAAKIRRVDPDDAAGTIVELDIGSSDKLTKDWWGAIIDDKGRRVSEWVHPDHVAQDISSLRISMNTMDARKFMRVALLKEKPEE